MKKLIRFGVSLDQHLLDDFDLHIKKRKYTNRSEALRDLIRDNLVGQEWDDEKETVGTITCVYDHQARDVTRSVPTFSTAISLSLCPGCMYILTLTIAWKCWS